MTRQLERACRASPPPLTSPSEALDKRIARLDRQRLIITRLTWFAVGFVLGAMTSQALFQVRLLLQGHPG